MMKRKSGDRPRERAPKTDKLEFDGVVTEALPNAMFRVKCDNELQVLATISEKSDRSHVVL